MEFDKEYQLHQLTEYLIREKELFDLKIVASEIQKDSQRMDNLAFDENANRFVIIEYKNENDAKVIKQAKDYRELLNNKHDEYEERLDEEKNIDYEHTKIMIITTDLAGLKIDEDENEDDFEIWKVTLNDDFKIIYENKDKNMKTKEKEERNIDFEEFETYLEEKTLKDASEDNHKKLYRDFKNQVKDFKYDVKLKFGTKFVSFRVNDKIICKVHFEKDLKIRYNTDKLSDPENEEKFEKLVDDISKLKYLGDYALTLNSEDDVDYALILFEKVYNQKKGKNN